MSCGAERGGVVRVRMGVLLGFCVQEKSSGMDGMVMSSIAFWIFCSVVKGETGTITSDIPACFLSSAAKNA